MRTLLEECLQLVKDVQSWCGGALWNSAAEEYEPLRKRLVEAITMIKKEVYNKINRR